MPITINTSTTHKALLNLMVGFTYCSIYGLGF